MKEIEMLRLVQNVVLRTGKIDKIDPKGFFNQDIHLPEENNLSSTSIESNLVGKEENIKSRNIFKFGDAETFCWDLREYIAKQKSKCIIPNITPRNQFEFNVETKINLYKNKQLQQRNQVLQSFLKMWIMKLDNFSPKFSKIV